MSRVSASNLPNSTSTCAVANPDGSEKWCPYRDGNSYCDEPRTNKGNSDAACHRMNNKDLLRFLEKIA